MKAKRLLTLPGLSLLGLFITSFGLAQTAGDFRSFQTGDWNNVATWERYDGGSWINPAPAAPVTADGAVTILSGHTVTVTLTDSINQLTVDAGGVLVVIDTVTLNIEDSAVPGIDLNLKGTLKNFGEVTLDPGAEISVADGGVYEHARNGGSIPTATWESGSTCEVTGAVGSAPSNASQNYHHFTWNSPGQTSNLNLAWDNITIGGNVTVISSGSNRFQFTSSTYSGTTITIAGDLIVTGGQVASNGSSGAATYTVEVLGDVIVTAGNLGVSRGSGGNATWRLHGNLSVSNATIQSSNPQSRFVFAKTDTQRVSFSSVTSTGIFHYEVDTSTILLIADGPDAIDVTIGDSLICRGEVIPQGTMSFIADAVYVHARDGGTIPTATWNTGSTCLVTGATGNAPGNANQDFYDFTWNCPNQTANLNVAWSGNTIGGNLKVVNSASSHFRLTNSTDYLAPVTIAGDAVVESGTLTATGSSSAATYTVNVLGNVIATGGTLAPSRGSGGNATWNIHGNFSVTNAELRTSNSASRFVLTGSAPQSVTLSNVTFTSAVNMDVDTGATAYMGRSTFAGAGTFEVRSGARVFSGHPVGLDSNLMAATVLLSSEADYGYNGAEAQVTGALLPDTVNRLIVDNSAGVTLGGNVMVNDSLELVDGTLSIGNSSIVATGVIGGSPSAYVLTDGSGVLSIPFVGAPGTRFPVGTPTSYAPVSITNGGTVDGFAVSVADDAGTTKPRVNLKWDIAEATAGGSNAQLQFRWMASAENAAFAADRAANAMIYNLTDTTEAGSGAYVPEFGGEPYALARTGFTTLGPFAVGNFAGGSTDVDDAEGLPTVFAIGQNYPNPFNPSTLIKYDIPATAHVTIRIYDVLGRVVTDLVNETQTPGFYRVKWNASGFASGVYYYRISAGDFTAVKKMMLVR